MRQKLGQHFLKNKSAVRAILDALQLKNGDAVIEIGPGKGALTIPLSKKCSEVGCQLIAIEKDPELAVKIKRLGARESLEVMQGDALQIIPEITKRYTLNPKRCILVGNIPYYITGKLLRVISELEPRPELVVLMVQKEVAERVAAKPGAMNLLAAATQIWADVKIIFRLKPKDFSPPPRVDSAIIELGIRNKELGKRDLDKYYKFIHAAFKQPRKTLINNLSDGLGITKTDALRIITPLGYGEKTRAQELGVDELWLLSQIANP